VEQIIGLLGKEPPMSLVSRLIKILNDAIECKRGTTERLNYHSYTVATSGVNRLASQICYNRLFRKKLQQNILPMISTEVSALAVHNTSPRELSKRSHLAHLVYVLVRLHELRHHVRKIHSSTTPITANHRISASTVAAASAVRHGTSHRYPLKSSLRSSKY
jgi:hypothetical protein